MKVFIWTDSLGYSIMSLTTCSIIIYIFLRNKWFLVGIKLKDLIA